MKARQPAPAVRFVQTEDLIPELCRFLEEVGFTPKQTRFIQNLPRVNAAESRKGRPWSDYFSPALLETVRHKERALFQVFPCYA